MFSLTKYRNRKDNNTHDFYSVTWEHFINRMSKHEIRTEKDGPAFSAVQYASQITNDFKFKEWIFFPKSNQKKGMIFINSKGETRITDLEYRITRANANVLNVSMIVMDFDKGGIKETHEKLNDFNHLIYTTFSNTESIPKFRLVIPLKIPIPVNQYKEAWERIFKITGEVADESCKDPARLHYLPSCPPETEQFKYANGFTDRKFFSPKIIKDEKKTRRSTKKKRGDYRTLKVVEWFAAHNAYQGPTGKTNQHWVDCPFRASHTDGFQGPTDACIYTDNVENWPTFKCSHAHCADKTIQDVISLWGDADEFCEREVKPSDIKTNTKIRALGHDESGRFFYQCNTNNNIVCLRAPEHKELFFYSITADWDYWFKLFGDADSGKINWRNAAISMMQQCQEVGFFRPNSVRGGGVWEDDGRTVVHLGKKLLVDSTETPITQMKSDHVYEAMVKNIELPPALISDRSSLLVDIVQHLPILNDVQKVLFAGHIVCGMLSGIMPWRPHLWLTGDAGSGKTSVLRHVVYPLWGPMGGIYCEGKTTEAGIRQQIRHNAVPIIIDESEANQKDEAIRISNLIGLARSSSSDSMANVYKGTTSGGGLSFTIRSSFLFCSVAHSLEWAQDRERFSLIQVRSTKESVEDWPGFRYHIKNTLTKEYALALYARCLQNINVIKDAIYTFHKVISEISPASSPRWRDQVGALLAGAYSLLSSERMSEAYAKKCFTNLKGWEEISDKDDTNASLGALKVLLAHIIQDPSVRKGIGELILNDLSPENLGSSNNTVLIRYGVLVKDNGIYIAADHPQTKRIFRSYGITGHYGLLSLLEGATNGYNVDFGAVKGKAVRIPIDYVKSR